MHVYYNACIMSVEIDIEIFKVTKGDLHKYYNY